MKKSVLLVFVLGAGLFAQTPDPAKPKEAVKPKTEVEQLRSDLDDEKARTAYKDAQLNLSAALMQAEAQFHLNERQTAMQSAYRALAARLGCTAGLDDKLHCAAEPPKPVTPVNTMPKNIAPTPPTSMQVQPVKPAVPPAKK